MFVRVLMMLVCYFGISVANAAPSNAQCMGNVQYKVERGDTLSKLAAECKSSVAILQRTNNINSVDLIYRGQEISFGKGKSENKAQVIEKRHSVVVTDKGPAYVFDDAQNELNAATAVSLLFVDAPIYVRAVLRSKYELNNDFEVTQVRVGEIMHRMLAANGKVYEGVLQAQLSDTPLPAKCFVAVNGEKTLYYLLIREYRGGNWYRHTVPITDAANQAAACGLNRITPYGESG